MRVKYQDEYRNMWVISISGIQGAREPRCRHAAEQEKGNSALSASPPANRITGGGGRLQHGDNDSLLPVISVLDHKSGAAWDRSDMGQ